MFVPFEKNPENVVPFTIKISDKTLEKTLIFKDGHTYEQTYNIEQLFYLLKFKTSENLNKKVENRVRNLNKSDQGNLLPY